MDAPLPGSGAALFQVFGCGGGDPTTRLGQALMRPRGKIGDTGRLYSTFRQRQDSIELDNRERGRIMEAAPEALR